VLLISLSHPHGIVEGVSVSDSCEFRRVVPAMISWCATKLSVVAVENAAGPLLFGTLAWIAALGEPSLAHQCWIGGVKTLHEFRREPARARIFRLALSCRALGEVIGKAPVWRPMLVQLAKDLVYRFPVVDLLELALARLPVFANYIYCRQPCGFDDRISGGSGAVQKFGAELDWKCDGRVTIGKNSAADAIARLQHDDIAPVLAQLLRGGKTRRTSTDDNRVEYVRLIHWD